MAKLDSIFADHESRLAPGLENPQAAVRDRLLYRSAEREAGTRPQRRPGGSMEAVLPGELDVASPELSIEKLGATGERDTTPAPGARDGIGEVGEIGNAGDMGDIGSVDDIGKRGRTGGLGGVDDLRESGGNGKIGDIGKTGDIGKVGDIGKLGDIGDVGNVDDVEEARRPDRARAGDPDGERRLGGGDEDMERGDGSDRRARRNLGDLDLADLDPTDLDLADLDFTDLDSDSLTDALSTSDDEDDDRMGSALRLAGLSV